MSLSRNGSAPSDEALMARVQNGDTDAFAELYDRHAVSAFRVARAICRGSGRAEEAVQEGFLAIWTSRAHFRPENGSFRAWSMSIVKNRAIDSYRAAAVRPPLQLPETQAEKPDAKSKSVQDQVVARSETDAMLLSLRKLPAAQAEVIALAFFGELSHSEIAAQLDLPPGTVKGRMRLGLEKLRKQMDLPA
ncbi:MAG: RNA polymerase sigma factor [Actinomycetota bacterium]|nr:RNA polymerase sigma factor [Actinomycetota bacterium]